MTDIPTISFRAPFPALLAFLRFPLNVLFPKYKTHVVPANAKTAALNARFEIIQSCTRPVNDRVGTISTVFRDGRTDEGIHDCCDSESRRVVAALSTCRSMEFATWSEYRFTSWGIEASWKPQTAWLAQVLLETRYLRAHVVEEKLVVTRHFGLSLRFNVRMPEGCQSLRGDNKKLC